LFLSRIGTINPVPFPHWNKVVTEALKGIDFSSLLRYNKDAGSFENYP
jgi:hypothetical protein